MKILIFSEKCNAAYDASAAQLADEMEHRGHEVHVLSVLQEDNSTFRQTSLRKRLLQKKRCESMLCEYAGKLKSQLESDSYDVIVATHAACAATLSVLYQNDDTFFPFMIYVCSDLEKYCGRLVLSCDAYITKDEREKAALQRWGIAPGLIHQTVISYPEATQICTIIEGEIQQWEDFKQAFRIDL